MDKSIANIDLARFKRDGYLLIKGLFSPDEVARFRLYGGGTTGSTDLVALPGLESLWADSRLVEIAKALLGTPITFFGEASHLRELFEAGKETRGHLHHDAKGTAEHLFNRQHSPTEEPYPIVRFAIYLQEHTRQSGGLKLVPRSHQMDSSDISESAFTFLDVPSEPGDAVVFCNKILHSAYALRRKDSPGIGISPSREFEMFQRDPSLFLPSPSDRRAIFIDFAGRDERADIYIKSRALYPSNLRKGFVDALRHGELLGDAERAGLGLRLDSAVVEAVIGISKAASGAKIDKTGRKLLASLPALCRLSQPWSGHYNFIPDSPLDDSEASALNLMNTIFPRIHELRQLVGTVRRDSAMLPRKRAR